jgi:hypothetical protein
MEDGTMRPSHTAWVVKNGREGSNEKSQWHPVGAVWMHKSGGGFDLVLADQISVSGRIVCVVRKEQKDSRPGDER